MNADRRNIDTVRRYSDAVARGDLQAVGNTFADDIAWHQPGHGSRSGLHRGKETIFALLGQFMARSGGTFRAEREGAAIAMQGMDLLRIVDGRIQDVWLFSEDQAAADAFWA